MDHAPQPEHAQLTTLDQARRAIDSLCDALNDARARLAEVLDLCDQQPKETPCSCDPAYTERGLIAPDCAWHQDIESFVADVRAAAEGDDRG